MLSQFQITLAVCGIVVGFLVFFGLGFLSGVWYQTQEQMLPYDDAITLADNQLERERQTSLQEREMTFYSSLTSREGTPEPPLQPRAATAPVPKSERPSPAAAVPANDSVGGGQSPSRRASQQVEPEGGATQGNGAGDREDSLGRGGFPSPRATRVAREGANRTSAPSKNVIDRGVEGAVLQRPSGQFPQS